MFRLNFKRVVTLLALIIALIVLLVMQCNAQISGNFKSVRLVNVSNDSTNVEDDSTFVDGGILYFNNTSKRLKLYDGTQWGEVGGGSVGTTWGSITGTINNQTDLQDSLLTKWSISGTTTIPSLFSSTNINAEQPLIFTGENNGFTTFGRYDIRFIIGGDNSLGLWTGSAYRWRITNQSVTNNGLYEDNNSPAVGLQYAADYSLETNGTDRSIPDLDAVRSLIGNVKVDTVNIGNWDMTAVTGLGVTVLSSKNIEAQKVVSIQAFIISDSGTDGYPLNRYNASASNIDGGIDLFQRPAGLTNFTVNLNRRTGGFFDSIAFDDNTINRGYLTIQYIE